MALNRTKAVGPGAGYVRGHGRVGDRLRQQVSRCHKVLLDAELATLYGVTTKRLNEQIKRNAARFPQDFMLDFPGFDGHAKLTA